MKYDKILLDHGAGGRASFQLVEDIFIRHFGGQEAARLEDASLLSLDSGHYAFSTDTFVVTPLFFPGGDIGDLAVNGTVNDLAMRGARPLYLSAGFIIEEGLEVSVLKQVVASMARAARTAGIEIVTGDTKVVPKGNADRLFINTAGIGFIPQDVSISAAGARAKDKLIVSGTIGDHGLAILTTREGLDLGTPIQSDTACLADLVRVIIGTGGRHVHVLRDPTRGGLGSTLNEIALSSNVSIHLEEKCIPIREQVQGACDILGLDPLYVANEGKLLALVAPEAAEDILAAVKAHELGREAAIVGQADNHRAGRVFLETNVGGQRILDMLTGQQLPRIC